MLMHILAMLTILVRHILFLMTILRCFQKTQSSPGVDELLHLSITFLNSSLEKGSHSKICFNENLSNRQKSI